MNIKKILLSLLLSLVVFFIGGATWIISLFSAPNSVYPNIAISAFLALWLLCMAFIWNWATPKTRLLAFVAAAVAMVATAAVYEANSSYHRNIDQVSESEVDLSAYTPFASGTLAATLGEPSTLKFTQDFPSLDGATALYPLYSAFVMATYPQDYSSSQEGVMEKYKTVDCTNTDGAYRRLISGDVDVIFVAGPSQGQLEMALQEGVELVLTPIGRESFVFFVNSKNPVDGLSISAVRDIYSGKVANWKELGGKNTAIRAYQRPSNSGSQSALARMMGDVPLMDAPKEDIVNMMGGMIENVSAYRNYDNAIGYSFLFYTTKMAASNKIKLLEINGVAPSKENALNGSYPFTSEFYAVTAGTENPNAQAFIDWILTSQGQALVDKTGYIPLN
ncbi:MAG: substrate-binding domain-containing protein [Eubacteriaceae bacterium]|nr:substrate-binding domain-containing protein [Eubacteriaceae bacterium]